jgi:WhiB family redox-sensing transcriptional regulator
VTVHHRPFARLNLDLTEPPMFIDLLGDELSWLTPEAVCAQVDTEIFFPDKGESNVHAKKVCHSCPLISDCLEYALTHEVFGVWGGTSPRERRVIRHRRAG